MNSFRNFVNDEQSQDIFEYTFVVVGLLVLSAFVAFSGVGGGMNAIHAGGSSVLATANTAAG